MNGRLAAAMLVAALVVVSAPFMGQARAALRQAFPGQFVLIVGLTTGAAIVAAVVLALLRIRDRRGQRYAAIGGALLIGTTYSVALATGNPEVDVVERVHFVEYGVITLLFFLAWRSIGDRSMFVLPVLAGVIVGSVEEWFQWFIPNRVGEVRDVALNLVAIGCGLLFSMGVAPPSQVSRTLSTESRRRLALAGAATVMALAGFVGTVHLGVVIEDEEGLTFRSRYSRGDLHALQQERANRWKTSPPLTFRRLSAEDQYLDEGFWHVRRRNQAWDAGDVAAAWGENRILEKYFGAVLDAPTYAGPPGRWSEEQRRDALQRAGAVRHYESDAEPHPILAWPPRLFWSLTAMVLVALGAIALARRGR